MTHDDVVAIFNELGYTATFAAVVAELNKRTSPPTPTPLESLYVLYPSREALAEAWLTDAIPGPSMENLQKAFSEVMACILGTLESRRDFSRAWLAAMKTTGPLHLVQLQRLHDKLHEYFIAWLDTHEAQVSLPANVPLLDVKEDIADTLCAAVSWLVLHWESDRSAEYGHTQILVGSVACLLDALLIARAEFDDAGLLVHLHRIFDQQHQRFIRPVLDVFLSPARAARLADPVSLIEIVRTLWPRPAQRP